jgi:predicted RND superfamily exporter protein
MGYMHFWGLTIDVVSSIIVIISIGLCVDYSAHIAHTFLTTKGKTMPRDIRRPEYSSTYCKRPKIRRPTVKG